MPGASDASVYLCLQDSLQSVQQIATDRKSETRSSLRTPIILPYLTRQPRISVQVRNTGRARMAGLSIPCRLWTILDLEACHMDVMTTVLRFVLFL